MLKIDLSNTNSVYLSNTNTAYKSCFDHEKYTILLVEVRFWHELIDPKMDSLL